MSVATAEDAERIRHELGSSRRSSSPCIPRWSSEEEARSFFEHCDIVTACASRSVRAEASKRERDAGGQQGADLRGHGGGQGSC